MSTERYALKGAVSEGLFSSERVVSFRDANGKDVSFFAPQALIVDGCAGAVVRVRVLQSEGALRLVSLPGDVYGGGQQVTVTSDQLEKV